MARFCSKCGHEVHDGEKFCEKCGSKIDDVNDIKNKSNGTNINDLVSNKLLCIVGIVIVVLLIFGLIGMFSGGDSTVTVNGVTFNIPDGYVERPDQTNEFIKGLESQNPSDYYEAKVYTKGDDHIILFVLDYSNANLNGMDGKSQTVNGHKGIVKYAYTMPMFYYNDKGNTLELELQKLPLMRL